MSSKLEVKKVEQKFTTILKGKTIKCVRYMTKEEMKVLMWHKRPVVITFTDGTLMFPQSDDEGNDGGVIQYQGKTDKEDTLLISY